MLRAFNAGDDRFVHAGKCMCATIDDDEPCFDTYPTVRAAVIAAHGCTDHACPVRELVTAPGDVAMCSCGQWYYGIIDAGGLQIIEIEPEGAAKLAREPMDVDETIAALDRAGEYMEVF